ncbi:hypothetical protein EUGRSUZ_L02667, partial [Eucalyptus grandis]
GSEHLLRLLQCRTAQPFQIKQVHALLITNGHLVVARNRWASTLLFNALIRGYSNFGQARRSLLLFTHMLAHRAPPNAITFTSLVKAAASSASLGTALHAQMVRRGVSSDPFVRVSIIHFYARIGELPGACRVFEEIPKPCVVACNAMLDAFGKSGVMGSAVSLFSRMPERDVVSWTSVINGLGSNRRFREALEFFRDMMVHKDIKSGVVKPNEATYVSLLSSCANLPGGGARYYGKQIHGYIVRNDTGLTAFVGTALIDFYGKTSSLRNAIKSRLLTEAMDFVKSMPFEPDASVLGALLLEMQPRHCGRYVTLSSIHAELNEWTSAAELRKAMEGLKLRKYSVNL